jgi:hypothetical protein
MKEQGMELTREYCNKWICGWDRFWFTPSDPATLGFLRICVGSMLLYSHLVWTIDLMAFFGPDGIFSTEFLRIFHGTQAAWSHFNWIDSPSTIWTVHIVALVVFACFAAGVFTRITGWLAFLFMVSYCNRASGTLFGLDEILSFLTFYLAIGPSGAAYSIDNWLRKKNADVQSVKKLVFATISIRLIQVHLCLVYLFAGLGKLKGTTWWGGDAIWYSFASYDYQTMDMTWLVDYPYVFQIMTHVALIWEVSYAFMVWNRTTRPIWVFLSIPVHLGIGLCMGMMTFGLIMIVANVSFVAPEVMRGLISRKPKLVVQP